MNDKRKKRTTSSTTSSRIILEGKRFRLPEPDRVPMDPHIPRPELIDEILPSCLSFDGLAPLNFRLYGPQGEGKTSLIFNLAPILKKDVYVIQGNEDMRATEVTCEPMEETGRQIVYQASKLFAAMYFGQIALFDEIGKSPPEALAPLLPVLDRRRTLYCKHANLTLKAKPGFLFCATLTEDEEMSLNWGDEFDQRMKPAFYVPRFSNEERQIVLKHHFPETNALWLDYFASHFKDEEMSTRDSINLLQYALNFHNSKYGRVKEVKKREVVECMKKAARFFLWKPNQKLSNKALEPEDEVKQYDVFDLIKREDSVH